MCCALVRIDHQVYKYNDPLTSYVLFPAFLCICVAYACKLDVLRVRLGSVVAIIGGIGLIANPVTTNEFWHLVFAFVTFLSSGLCCV